MACSSSTSEWEFAAGLTCGVVASSGQSTLVSVGVLTITKAFSPREARASCNTTVTVGPVQDIANVPALWLFGKWGTLRV